MARPVKNTVDYFPHSVSHKTTLYIIESKFGNDGYAFWFKLLELIGKTPGHTIDCKNLPVWEFMLSYAHLDHEKAISILNLLADLSAIDKDLWKSKIIWSQNFIDGITDVYKRRSMEIPPKPQPNGFYPQKSLSLQKNNSNYAPPIVSVDNNSDNNPIPVDNNSDNNPISVDNNTQRKGKERKGKEIKGKENGEITPSNNDFNSFKGTLNSTNDKVSVFIEAFKEWHKDAPDLDDFENFGGMMAGLVKACNKDYGYLLQIMWDLCSKPPAGSRIKYMYGIIKNKNSKDKEKSIKSSYHSGAGVTPELKEAMKHIPTVKWDMDEMGKKDGK